MEGGVCTIKLRLPNGQTLEETFGENDSLLSVAHYVRENSTLKNFLLSIPMPRRVFSPDELANTTLKAAGMSPRGMLIVQAGIATDMKQDTTPIIRPGGVKHIHNASEYNSLKATKGKLVVAKFSAEWCGPCKAIAPKYEDIAKKTDGVFMHIDVDEVDDVQDAQDVKGIPTFKFFKNGSLVHQFSGADESQLEDTVRKFK